MLLLKRSINDWIVERARDKGTRAVHRLSKEKFMLCATKSLSCVIGELDDEKQKNCKSAGHRDVA